MVFLKQSTSVVIPFGPFLDKTDGVTLETGLVSAIDHVTTGIMLSKNGGTLTIRSQAVTTSTYDARGCYKVTLSTTDTNTLGSLRVIYTDATTCLPVWQDFGVLVANVYDSLVGNTDNLQVDTTQVAGSSIQESSGYVKVSEGTGTGQLDLTSGRPGIDLAKVSNVTTVLGLSGTTIKAVTDAVSSVSGNVGGSVVGSVASVIGTVGSVTGNVGGNVGGNVSGSVASVTATVNASVTQLNGDATAASNLQKSASTIVQGTAVTGTLSTTQMTTNLTESTDDHFNGRIIIFTSGVLQNQATNITDYAGTTKLLTFTALTESPSNLYAFVIL